jgi:hypothetical protein
MYVEQDAIAAFQALSNNALKMLQVQHKSDLKIVTDEVKKTTFLAPQPQPASMLIALAVTPTPLASQPPLTFQPIPAPIPKFQPPLLVQPLFFILGHISGAHVTVTDGNCRIYF